jgi:GNAT superfamily N-acetyltransferase
MLIRPAEADEVGELVRAYDWLFAPPGSTPVTWNATAAADRLRAAIASDDADVLVADEDGTIIGVCSIYDDIDSVRFGHRVWIEDLAVDPEWRSRGIGHGLMEAAMDWARTRGASHLELDSAPGRVDAHRFYESLEPSWSSISFGWLLS